MRPSKSATRPSGRLEAVLSISKTIRELITKLYLSNCYHDSGSLGTALAPIPFTPVRRRLSARNLACQLA